MSFLTSILLCFLIATLLPVLFSMQLAVHSSEIKQLLQVLSVALLDMLVIYLSGAGMQDFHALSITIFS